LIDAIRKTEAKGAAAMALLYLSEQADENDSIQISTRKVAEAIGYSPSTTRDAMTCLLDLGEIELQKPGQRGRAAHYLGSSFKCNTQSPLGIGCCDGHTKQAPQQRGTWRDISRA